MIVKEVTDIIEALAPLDYAESFDNAGLLVGSGKAEVSGILITLDALEEVVDEAVEKGCNLIVSFHPIIFSGLKQLTGATYVERTVIKAIRNDIAIYATHTALDNAWDGVNAKIMEVLEIKDRQVLLPSTESLRKLTTYVPVADAPRLKEALFSAGAGHIGKYSHCSFTVEGMGSYLAGEGANPARGAVGSVHYEKEGMVNLIYPKHREKSILRALHTNHPYEEVAYEIVSLENTNRMLGMGMIGSLAQPMEEKDFLKFVKDRLNTEVIRHTALSGKKVARIAVLGGSGAFAIRPAIAMGADVLITADIKYHEFFQARGNLLLVDVGHYESEKFTKNLLLDYLIKKIPNFAISLSENITNPIKYYY